MSDFKEYARKKVQEDRSPEEWWAVALGIGLELLLTVAIAILKEKLQEKSVDKEALD